MDEMNATAPAKPLKVRAKCTLCNTTVEVGPDALQSRPAPEPLHDITEYGVECPACGGWNHRAFVNAKLLRLRGNLRTFTRPVEFEHAVRYYDRKFEAFQRECLARLLQAKAKEPMPEQEKIFQLGVEHLEREAAKVQALKSDPPNG